MLRSSHPPPVSSMASQMAASVTIAAMKRHCTRRGGRSSLISRSTAKAATRCACLELHSRANADGPRPPRNDEGTRAASARREATEFVAFVEDVRSEHLEAVPRPVEAREQVDQRRRMELALEEIGI